MATLGSNDVCFLCRPDPGLIYERDESFLAMLGWGPIGIGYSIIATVEHVPSMFDLTGGQLAELDAFTAKVRSLLGDEFGPSVITEHGRVAPCVAAPTQAYEPHCLHAHRLAFCGLDALDVRELAPGYDWQAFPSSTAARAGDLGGQYLYCEEADGSVELAPVGGPLPRQFFRSLAAVAAGEPELANWRTRRGEAMIAQARRALGEQ